MQKTVVYLTWKAIEIITLSDYDRAPVNWSSFAVWHGDQKGVGKWDFQEQLGGGQWKKKGMSWGGVPGTKLNMSPETETKRSNLTQRPLLL